MEPTMIAGRHPVGEALIANKTIHKLFIANQTHGLGDIVAAAKAAGVVTQFVDKRKLDQMVAGVRHQGVVAVVAMEDYVEVDELFVRAAQRQAPPLFVILDEIEDPHNFGSIMRTVDGAGAHGMIIPKRRSAGLTATVGRTSAGAMAHVPVARVTNIAQTIEQLKRQGVWVMGTVAGDAHTPLYEASLQGPLAIVIGNEETGIGRLVRERCDVLIHVPMYGKINSLNASVATALVLYEAVRQRNTQRGV